jgi:DNA-binding winged helix-turn-helix (wHTH) protein
MPHLTTGIVWRVIPEGAPPVLEPILFPPFRLDRLNRRLYCGARPIALREKSLAVLECLASRPRALVSKNELMEAVWADTAVTETVLKVCIREIRKALEDDGKQPRFIVFGPAFRRASQGTAVP